MIGRRRERPDPFREWPEEARSAARAHLEAHLVATRRIQGKRRRLDQESAEGIVREEAAKRGITREEGIVEETARIALLPPWWPVLHPRQAREAGWRLAWEKDD